MDAQNNQQVISPFNPIMNTSTSRIQDFCWMNLLVFSETKSKEGPQEFLDCMQMVTNIMGATSSESADIVAY